MISSKYLYCLSFFCRALLEYQFSRLESNATYDEMFFFITLFSTFVCPTEIIAFSDAMSKFKALNTEVIGVSTDSHFSHLAWINLPRKQGGLGGLNYPLLSDFNKTIAKDYGVLVEDQGLALRYDCLKPLELQI